MKNNEELTELFLPILQEKGISADPAKTAKIIGLVKDRISFVKELWAQTSYFFIAPESYEEKSVKKRWKEDTPERMKELLGWITENNYHMGNVMNAFRLAVVGECKGPHMFDITTILGKEETIKRIKKAIEVLQ